MLAATLLDHTRALFPDFLPEQIDVTPLEKGGSERKFYRIEMGPSRSLILVKYNDQREENAHYVDVARFLADHEINAPEIYHHDAGEGLIWMQDLGEIDLWAFREKSWEIRKQYYHQTLDQLVRLHGILPSAAEKLHLQPVFDERLYRWEQEYFFENCLGRHFGLETELKNADVFQKLAFDLASLPKVLVHRDFQSQNIMVRDENAWLIDFQGMRPGLRQYDLASLLYDPYVDLTNEERAELLAYYQTASGVNDPDFQKVFLKCAMQRLMQALGAYGFLGHVKGRADFLAHTPKALASLKEVIVLIPEMDVLGKLLGSLPTS